MAELVALVGATADDELVPPLRGFDDDDDDEPPVRLLVEPVARTLAGAVLGRESPVD